MHGRINIKFEERLLAFFPDFLSSRYICKNTNLRFKQRQFCLVFYMYMKIGLYYHEKTEGFPEAVLTKTTAPPRKQQRSG